MFNARRIIIIHELISQDFPTSHGADEEKIIQLYSECEELFNNNGDKTFFNFAACVSYKIVKGKPFHSQNKKVAIRAAISILNERKFEITASYNEMIAIMEEVDSKLMTIEQLADFYRNNSKRI